MRVLLLLSMREQWSESEHDSSNSSITNQADLRCASRELRNDLLKESIQRQIDQQIKKTFRLKTK